MAELMFTMNIRRSQGKTGSTTGDINHGITRSEPDNDQAGLPSPISSLGSQSSNFTTDEQTA